MCYDAAMDRKVKRLEKHYGVERNRKFDIGDSDFITHHLKGVTHPEILVIPQESKKELHPMVWGLVPGQIPGFKHNDYYTQGRNTVYCLNARSEKMFTYDLYKDSIFTKRCIIPLTAFFEPHSFMNTSYPFLFKDKEDGFLSVAGIYSESSDGAVRTMSMLTKKGSDLFSTIHNADREGHRQIVLLNQELQSEWLRDDLTEKHIQELVDIPYDDSSLSFYPVSRNLYSKTKHSNDSYISERAEYPELAFNSDLAGLI